LPEFLALLAVADRTRLANRIGREGCTVRRYRSLGENSGKTTRPRRAHRLSTPTRLPFRKKLALALGTKVTIRIAGRAARSASPSGISTSSTTSAAGFALRHSADAFTVGFAKPVAGAALLGYYIVTNHGGVLTMLN